MFNDQKEIEIIIISFHGEIKRQYFYDEECPAFLISSTSSFW